MAYRFQHVRKADGKPKKTYATRTEALKVCDPDLENVYICQICYQYHIGHKGIARTFVDRLRIRRTKYDRRKR